MYQHVSCRHDMVSCTGWGTKVVLRHNAINRELLQPYTNWATISHLSVMERSELTLRSQIIGRDFENRLAKPIDGNQRKFCTWQQTYWNLTHFEGMWDVHLGSMLEEHYWIKLKKEDNQPIHSRPLKAWPKSGEVGNQLKIRMLARGNIKPARPLWKPLIVFTPNFGSKLVEYHT